MGLTFESTLNGQNIIIVQELVVDLSMLPVTDFKFSHQTACTCMHVWQLAKRLPMRKHFGWLYAKQV